MSESELYPFMDGPLGGSFTSYGEISEWLDIDTKDGEHHRYKPVIDDSGDLKGWRWAGRVSEDG